MHLGGGVLCEIFYCISRRRFVWGPHVTEQQGNSYHKVVCSPFVVDMCALGEVLLISIVYFHTGNKSNKMYDSVSCLNAPLTVCIPDGVIMVFKRNHIPK